MMQEHDLHELAELVSEDAPILSLYLHLDPQRRSADESKLSLRRLLAQASARAQPRRTLSASNVSSSTSMIDRAGRASASVARRGNSGGAIRSWSPCRALPMSAGGPTSSR